MIKSRVPTQQYKDNYDKIFGKPVPVTESKSVQKRRAAQDRSARCPAPKG